MADQDAQDINQMMSASAEVGVSRPKSSKFIWIVLACVVVGVGLGVVVYQQSIKTTVKPSPTPKVAVAPTAKPSVIPSPVVPQTNLITQVANTVTFPEAGKIRVFNNLNNIQLLITVTIGGVKKTLTIPNKTLTSTQLMAYADSTFDVKAGEVGTIEAFLNSESGPKMGGWILPATGEICGANTGGKVDVSAQLAYAQTLLGSSKTPFAKQCWADDIDPKDPSSYDFNDFYLVWGYVPPATTASVSPSPSSSARASVSPSSSPSSSPSPSASAKASTSPSPSASAKASSSPTATPTPTPTPNTSPRVTMPDTSGGTPVTGVFEITVGTVSIGLLLLVLGVFGLLVL